MGKKKVRFIDPKKAQHFHLVRRSQHDAAGHLDGASTHVLLPATKGQGGNKITGGEAGFWETGSSSSHLSSLQEARDHINEIGLPNDGYDYSQHLKEIGGGRFISSDGRVTTIESRDAGRELHLPDEVFASHEIDRRLDSITISADCMDEEIAEALFGDDEGEFEELDDDFVVQAAEEAEDGDGAADGFDYEAHIARLMEASERAMGWAPARGWEDGDLDGLQLLRKPRGSDFDSEEDEDEDDDEIEYEMPKNVTGERYKTEKDFVELLADYDDDEIGELDEPAEEGAVTRGQMDMEELDGFFGQVLDDFLKASKDKEQGAYVPAEPGRNGKKKSLKAIPEAEGDGPIPPPPMDDEDEPLQPEDAEDFDRFIQSHAYLGDVREECQWDCETVLTTCSNTDNLPTVIGEPRKHRRPQRQGTDGAAKAQDGEAPSAAMLIELSRKTGLPRGVLPEKEKKEKVTGANVGEARSREETKEEKAARKAAIKAARRETRERKKDSRIAFKDSAAVATVRASNPETATKRSVFRYSA